MARSRDDGTPLGLVVVLTLTMALPVLVLYAIDAVWGGRVPSHACHRSPCG